MRVNYITNVFKYKLYIDPEAFLMVSENLFVYVVKVRKKISFQ